MSNYPIQAIGRVRSPYRSRGQAPKQGEGSPTESWIDLEREFAQGLSGIGPGRWLWVIYLFDRAKAPRMMIHPRGDKSRPLTGLFNTRSPDRPAPLGLSLVKVLSLEGASLRVVGLEALDNSPVLDIKPHISGGDAPWED